jgi:hypothetical protein
VLGAGLEEPRTQNPEPRTQNPEPRTKNLDLKLLLQYRVDTAVFDYFIFNDVSFQDCFKFESGFSQGSP